MDDERVRKLGESLCSRAVYPVVTGPCGAVARGILEDPQEHINALVRAGVLEIVVMMYSGLRGPKRAYTVVPHEPPHEHEWSVGSGGGAGVVYLRCAGCNRGALVPNRLPIEAPE